MASMKQDIGTARLKSSGKYIYICKRGPAAYMGGFGGAEDHNSEVKLYDTGIK